MPRAMRPGPPMARKLDSLGESPADVFERVRREAREDNEVTIAPQSLTGGGSLPPVPGVPTAVSAELEGFGAVENPVVVEDDTPVEAPSPEKAIAMIQTLSQTNQQLQVELDAAYNVIDRYKERFGDLEE